jgi:hypothetical protein
MIRIDNDVKEKKKKKKKISVIEVEIGNTDDIGLRKQ